MSSLTISHAARTQDQLLVKAHSNPATARPRPHAYGTSIVKKFLATLLRSLAAPPA